MNNLCSRARSGLIYDTLWRVHLPHETLDMLYPWSVFKGQKVSVFSIRQGTLVQLAFLIYVLFLRQLQNKQEAEAYAYAI